MTAAQVLRVTRYTGERGGIHYATSGHILLASPEALDVEATETPADRGVGDDWIACAQRWLSPSSEAAVVDFEAKLVGIVEPCEQCGDFGRCRSCDGEGRLAGVCSNCFHEHDCRCDCGGKPAECRCPIVDVSVLGATFDGRKILRSARWIGPLTASLAVTKSGDRMLRLLGSNGRAAVIMWTNPGKDPVPVIL